MNVCRTTGKAKTAGLRNLPTKRQAVKEPWRVEYRVGHDWPECKPKRAKRDAWQALGGRNLRSLRFRSGVSLIGARELHFNSPPLRLLLLSLYCEVRTSNFSSLQSSLPLPQSDTT
jgi:hypothetical protein